MKKIILQGGIIPAFLLLLLVGAPAISGAAEDLKVKASLLDKSPLPTPQELGSYTEGLVVYLYEVQEVLEGELEDEKILVTHYGIYDTAEQDIAGLQKGDTREMQLKPFDSPELEEVRAVYRKDNWERDFMMQRFHDVSQDLKRPKPANNRFDYGKTDFSDKLARLVGLRNQLRTISIGDSQTAEGIIASAFHPMESAFYPVALNAGIGSQQLDWPAMIIQDYAADMPELEYIVLGLNPRMFREERADTTPHEVTKTPGYKADMELAKAGWPMPDELVVYSRNDEVILPNRYEIKRLRRSETGTGADQYDKESTQVVHKRIKKKYVKRDTGFPTEWNMAESSRKLFEKLLATAEKNNVRVFGFIPPVHPVLLEYPEAVDEDHTTPEGYNRLVAYLEGLEQKFPNFQFEDISNKADHFLPGDHFRDTDHLVSAGAAKLTAHIANLLEDAPKPEMDVQVQGKTVTLKTGVENARWLLSDQSVLSGGEVTHTFANPGKYFVGLVGETGERLNGENWTTVEIPESAFEEGEWEHNEDIRPNLQVHDDHKNLPRGVFVNAAGSDDTFIATWDFGDGNSAAGWIHQHTYDKPGEYTVTLTCFAETGQVKEVTETVRVK